MTDQSQEKIKKSRNLTLLVAVLVSISATLRWLGLYGLGEDSISPWFSTILALVLFLIAAYHHKRLAKL